MSRENVERVRQGYEALARGEVEPVLALFDPQIVVEDHDRTLSGPGVYQGHAGFLRMFSSVNEGFDDVRYTPETFDDRGTQILVKVRRTGRGSASGVSVEESQFHVFDFEGARVTRFRACVDRAEALEAVGLRE